MLKQGETLFLDDLSVAEVAEKLQTPIIAVNGIEELIAAMID
jgi:NifB/MoaA-like Fe-S oxidoreductase